MGVVREVEKQKEQRHKDAGKIEKRGFRQGRGKQENEKKYYWKQDLRNRKGKRNKSNKRECDFFGGGKKNLITLINS